jgi:hypothetical protein
MDGNLQTVSQKNSLLFVSGLPQAFIIVKGSQPPGSRAKAAEVHTFLLQGLILHAKGQATMMGT